MGATHQHSPPPPPVPAGALRASCSSHRMHPKVLPAFVVASMTTLRSGAKMVNAVANSVVPKFTFIVGNSYGAGNYAMCGRAYDPRLLFAWPTAQIAVMGGKQASETLLGIKVQAMEKGGEHISKEKQAQLLKEIQDRYEAELDPFFAAARLSVDGIIDPTETRDTISRGIEMASNNPDLPRFNPGIIQT